MSDGPIPRNVEVPVEGLDVSAFEIPTETESESDGTLEWDSTTMVLVEVHAGGETGIGYTYAHSAAAKLIDGKLRGYIEGSDAVRVRATWHDMVAGTRNLGYTGLTMMAISAVDVSLWDLKARLLGLPLAALLDPWHEAVPVYGSGGFCNYTHEQLRDQMLGWVEQGIGSIKMKVARDPERDVERVKVVRDAIGDGVELFVDANGAYDRKQALEWARRFSDLGASWFEEPVTSDDLEGLRLLRDRGPAGMDVAAGEYGFNPTYFAQMIDAGAVDVIQPDATRCGGITALLEIGGLCQSHHVPVSGHTAPSIHAHGLTAVRPVRHLEYFFDHARIEGMLFEGTLSPAGGALHPDPSRAGLGLELKRADAEKFVTYSSS